MNNNCEEPENIKPILSFKNGNFTVRFVEIKPKPFACKWCINKSFKFERVKGQSL